MDHAKLIRFAAATLIAGSINCQNALGAGWYCAHGNAGRLENPDNVNTSRNLGSGLEIDQKPGRSNTVHFPIATPIENGLIFVTRIAFQFYTYGPDITVGPISLWSLSDRLRTLEPSGLEGDGWHTMTVDLDAPLRVSAVDIGFDINAATRNLNNRIRFTGACAYFESSRAQSKRAARAPFKEPAVLPE